MFIRVGEVEMESINSKDSVSLQSLYKQAKESSCGSIEQQVYNVVECAVKNITRKSVHLKVKSIGGCLFRVERLKALHSMMTTILKKFTFGIWLLEN